MDNVCNSSCRDATTKMTILKIDIGQIKDARNAG